MKYRTVRPVEDLLITLEDGTVPIHEIFMKISHSPRGKPFENYHLYHPRILVCRYAPMRSFGPDHETFRRCVCLEYPSDFSFRDPGGDHDITIWDDYSIATYWGHGISIDKKENSKDNDRGIYKYLESIGYLERI